MKTYVEINKDIINLNAKKFEIIESSMNGTVQTIPVLNKKNKDDIQNNIEFDKVYKLYKKSNHLEYSLADFLKGLKMSPTELAMEKTSNFLGIRKEYSLFQSILNKHYQQQPIAWSICLSHDDELLNEAWLTKAVKGYRMGSRTNILHTLHPELKNKILKKNKWCVLSWIVGNNLEDSLDCKELEKIFQKSDLNKYAEIIHPEAFGAQLISSISNEPVITIEEINDGMLGE
jgi:hypothetical protein